MSDKENIHLYEVSLTYVFEHFARFYAPPPGRHNVKKAEWIVDREQGRVVFKLYTEPDDAPPEVESPENGERQRTAT